MAVTYRCFSPQVSSGLHRDAGRRRPRHRRLKFRHEVPRDRAEPAGSDPREARIRAQRICGVCTTVHAPASVRAVENALGIEARRATGPQHYRGCAERARSRGALLSPACARLGGCNAGPEGRSGKDFAAGAVDPGVAEVEPQRILRESRTASRPLWPARQLNLFSSGDWGHPAYQLPPEANLLAVAHYIDALDMQRGSYSHPRGPGR